ncbi:Putidaredoxin reductase [Ascidiaceihabitans donghaensis]|uniref:Putidaredoxin reductase n=1 Tax=Ascidiaceihabitans donghaensis TaxID=1510460 RepID=A0A2R8BEP7_9RHOB|nr:FAD-dependent oxidoreductase [Ascidiaceihabitans donghaensis]SPH21485.1 Putidaredoxin reductase [Ascidiaceihabitans donghaensis]
MTPSAAKSIVLVGGGHTHALVLNALKAAPLAGADVTVINPGKTAPYSGMLPGFVAGHYTRQELDIDLAALCRRVGANLIDGKAVAMNLERKTVQLENGTDLNYDLASVDVGITSRMDALPGFQKYGVPAKPLDRFSRQWDRFRNQSGPKHVAIIGGGIAGAELAMAMAWALRQHDDAVSVTLLDRSKILSANSTQTQNRIRRELKANAVDVREGVDVAEVTAASVIFADGTETPANFIVGAAGATPHDWITDTGLILDAGFIEVSDTLETSAPGVFAVGDCAHMGFAPRPKAGVYAVRQAPVLLQNLRNSMLGDALQMYDPQSDYLKLVSLGGKRAFGEKRGWSAAGHLVWRVKDHIDRSFMNQF